MSEENWRSCGGRSRLGTRATWRASSRLVASDVEFIPLRVPLEGSAYRGPEGVRQFASDAAEEWEFLRISSDEFRDPGEFVLMLGHFDGRGRGSGMDIRFPVGWVARLSEAKIVHPRTYSDPPRSPAVGAFRPTPSSPVTRASRRFWLPRVHATDIASTGAATAS
jgi:hypothetical protein